MKIPVAVVAVLSVCLNLQAQSISNQWLIRDSIGLGGGGGSVGCDVPSNVIASSGLAITASSVPSGVNLPCGDAAHAPVSYSYSSGSLVSVPFTFTYGVIDFTVSTPAGQGTGLWPAVWLMGANCLTGAETGGLWCQPYPASGYNEIDLAEWTGTTNVNQEIFVGEGTSGHNDNCTLTGQSPGSTYHVVVTWTNGSLVWQINGTTTCTITQSYVPSTPMFVWIDFWIGGSSGSPSGVIWPQTFSVGHFRVCPVGTVTCDQAHATMFDDEFTGGSGGSIGPAGPQGPQGIQGPPGPQGPPGGGSGGSGPSTETVYVAGGSVVTSGRTTETVYRNTGSTPLYVEVCILAGGSGAAADVLIGPTSSPGEALQYLSLGNSSPRVSSSFIVLPGYYYEVSINAYGSGSNFGTLRDWRELQ